MLRVRFGLRWGSLEYTVRGGCGHGCYILKLSPVYTPLELPIWPTIRNPQKRLSLLLALQGKLWLGKLHNNGCYVTSTKCLSGWVSFFSFICTIDQLPQQIQCSIQKHQTGQLVGSLTDWHSRSWPFYDREIHRQYLIIENSTNSLHTQLNPLLSTTL